MSTLSPIDHATTVRLLEPPSSGCSVIIDTDTWNEVDDQFAIIHALMSPELRIETIQAAGFHAAVRNTDSFEHGMELSYEEIQRVLELSPVSYDGPVLYGSRQTMTATGGEPVPSDAADNIVSRAMRDRDETLYVLALGSLTNVASAVLMEPRIRERICVVALGGWPYHVAGFHDFNFIQDIKAAQAVFDSGVAMVHVTGFGVSELLRTTRWEMMQQVKGARQDRRLPVPTIRGLCAGLRGPKQAHLGPGARSVAAELGLAEDPHRGSSDAERPPGIQPGREPPSYANR